MTRAKGLLARTVPAALAVLALAAPTAHADAVPVAGASSLRVDEAAAAETRTNGRIFGFYPHQGRYACSGTALNTPSRSIVLTAGHCVKEGGSWGRKLVFVPAYDHGARPFGTFVASSVYAMRGWRKDENSDFDVAALKVKPNQFGALADVVGGRDWVTGRSRFSSFQIFGYPGGALHGEELRRCATKGLGNDDLTNALHGPPTIPSHCDMARGSSGGAWLVNGQYVDGVTSYGYRLYGFSDGRLYSPYFGPAVGSFLRHLP